MNSAKHRNEKLDGFSHLPGNKWVIQVPHHRHYGGKTARIGGTLHTQYGTTHTGCEERGNVPDVR